MAAGVLLLLTGAALGSHVGPCGCEPMLAPRRVFFNRVPKCGSTTMESFIAAAVKKHGFTFRRSPDYTHQHLSHAQRSGFVRYITSNPPPFLYDRHLHFIRFEEFGKPSPIYLNIVRDPVAVRTSDFYFHRECVCSVRSDWCRSEWSLRSPAFCNRTIDDAYANVTEPIPSPGFITAFFCGHEKECAVAPPRRTPGSHGRMVAGAAAPYLRNLSATVAVAKRHARDRYAWVGVLEDFSDSLRLLSHLLPNYFGGLSSQFWAAQKHRPAGTKQGTKPSAETAAKMRIELAPDYEVYDYVRRILRCKLRACQLVRQPQNLTPAQAAQALVDRVAERVDAELLDREAANARAIQGAKALRAAHLQRRAQRGKGVRGGGSGAAAAKAAGVELAGGGRRERRPYMRADGSARWRPSPAHGRKQKGANSNAGGDDDDDDENVR